MFLSANERRVEEQAMLERQKRLDDALKKQRETDSKVNSDRDQEVDDFFKFLREVVPGQEGQAPTGFTVRVELVWW